MERNKRTARFVWIGGGLFVFTFLFLSDLMTLGIMCGMSESDARDAVYTNCELSKLFFYLSFSIFTFNTRQSLLGARVLEIENLEERGCSGACKHCEIGRSFCFGQR